MECNILGLADEHADESYGGLVVDVEDVESPIPSVCVTQSSLVDNIAVIK